VARLIDPSGKSRGCLTLPVKPETVIRTAWGLDPRDLIVSDFDPVDGWALTAIRKHGPASKRITDLGVRAGAELFSDLHPERATAALLELAVQQLWDEGWRVDSE
jgi:hypothetical protein